MMKSSNNKERLFWRAFLKGCKNDLYEIIKFTILI